MILSKSDGYQIVPDKLTFVYFSELKDWSVRDMGNQGKLSEEDEALINKVTHMLFDINCDFESVIRMLYSFRNGPKSGIKVADPEDNYEWTNKDGNQNILLRIFRKHILDGIGEDILYQRNLLSL